MSEMKLIVDCSTGEEQYIPLTAKEIADREAQTQAWLEQEALMLAEQTAKDALKASAINKLVTGKPLTEAEAALLVIG
jgi:hypothetical protein